MLEYRYRGTDPQHHDNVGLRRAFREQIPLVYFYGVVPGLYLAFYPSFGVGDDPQRLTFTVAIDERGMVAQDFSGLVASERRRRYQTQLARQRLHQAAFRERVLRAYHQQCSICRLRHRELLDAAHILADRDPRGEPVVSNGLSLCKLHHAAFDRHIVGIRPDLVIDIRQDILEEVDGPMLQHGIQGFQGQRLVIPRSSADRPDTTFLEERYERFRTAS